MASFISRRWRAIMPLNRGDGLWLIGEEINININTEAESLGVKQLPSDAAYESKLTKIFFGTATAWIQEGAAAVPIRPQFSQVGISHVVDPVPGVPYQPDPQFEVVRAKTVGSGLYVLVVNTLGLAAPGFPV